MAGQARNRFTGMDGEDKVQGLSPRAQNSEVGEVEPAIVSGTPDEVGRNPEGSASWKPGPGKDRNQIHICHCVSSPSVVSNSLDPVDCSTPGSSVLGIFQARYWRGLPFPTPSMLLRGQLNRETSAH